MGTRDTFRVGEVLSQSGRIYLRNLPAFAFLSFLAVVPTILYIMKVEPTDAGAESVDTFSLISYFILGNVVTAAVTFGVVMQLGGKRTSFLSSVGRGVARALPVIGVGLAMSLLVVGGFLLFIVPGVVLICMYYVAIPVAVVERAGIGQSLGRSGALTEGSRWRIFGLFLASFVIMILPGMLISNYMEPGEHDSWATWRTYSIVYEIIDSIMGAFMSVTAAVAYHALRQAKEGVSVEELMAVFE